MATLLAGKGYIVKKEWLDDCARKGKRVSEDRYALSLLLLIDNSRRTRRYGWGARAASAHQSSSSSSETSEESEEDDLVAPPLVRMDADSDPEFVPQACPSCCAYVQAWSHGLVLGKIVSKSCQTAQVSGFALHNILDA